MPVLAPPRLPGPGHAQPNFAVERSRMGHPQIGVLSGTSILSGASISIALTAAAGSAAVGDFVLVAFAWATSTVALSTVTDTSGNSWTVVSTPAVSNESGGYAYTIVTTGWSAGSNTITGTLASASPGGRLGACVKIPAAFNPVVDQHAETATDAYQLAISNASPLAQETEVVFLTDIQRTGNSLPPAWTWDNVLTPMAMINGSGTVDSGLAIAEYDNIAGTAPLTVGFLGTASNNHHGTGLIAVKVTIPGGSTAWTQNVNDSVTVSDALSFDRGLALADSVTVPDALSFDRGLALADSVTVPDALAFDRGLVLPGDSVTVTDGITVERGLNVSVGDSVTVSDALAFDRGLGIADSVTPTDALAFARDIHLADTVTPTDALAFDRGLSIADSVTLSDALSRGFGINPADSVTVTDALAFDRLLALIDSVTASDALAFDRGLFLSDSVAVADLVDAALLGTGVPSWQEIVLCYCYNGHRMVQAVEPANEVVTASVVSEVQAAVVAVEVPASVVMVEVL